MQDNKIYSIYYVVDGKYSSVTGVEKNEVKSVSDELVHDMQEHENHLCPDCKNLLKCPRTTDITKKLLKEGNYEYVLSGLQLVEEGYNPDFYSDDKIEISNNLNKFKRFLVAKCKNFKQD